MSKDSNPNNWRLVAKENLEEISSYLLSLVPDGENVTTKTKLGRVIHTLDSGVHATSEVPGDFITKKQRFINDWAEVWGSYKEGYDPKWIVVSIELPNGAVEIITNSQETKDKFEYYINNYDDNLQMKTFPAIEILSWMFV